MSTSIVILAGAAAAALAAWQLGGPQGAGVLAGYLCGASASGLWSARQRQILRRRPELALGTMATGFLFKLAFVLTGALTLRYVDAAAARIDWRSFLVTFAAAVLLVTAVDTVRALQDAAARRRDPAPTTARLEELEAL